MWSLASPVLGVLSLSAVGSSVAGSNIMGVLQYSGIRNWSYRGVYTVLWILDSVGSVTVLICLLISQSLCHSMPACQCSMVCCVFSSSRKWLHGVLSAVGSPVAWSSIMGVL